MGFAAVAILAAFSILPAAAASTAATASVCKELRAAHFKAKTTRGGLMERRRAARAIREAGCR